MGRRGAATPPQDPGSARRSKLYDLESQRAIAQSPPAGWRVDTPAHRHATTIGRAGRAATEPCQTRIARPAPPGPSGAKRWLGAGIPPTCGASLRAARVVPLEGAR